MSAFDPFAISRATDASWRHFASTSGSTPKHTMNYLQAVVLASKKPTLMINWNLGFVSRAVDLGGEDYLESHPISEAAKHLFYQYPAEARWCFAQAYAEKGSKLF